MMRFVDRAMTRLDMKKPRLAGLVWFS